MQDRIVGSKFQIKDDKLMVLYNESINLDGKFKHKSIGFRLGVNKKLR
ncbi:hypothetical protein RZE82_02140 [Mollicutes bacterium LVI A0039]|nr:hypothetical protein RZE82_02140 [Mollicutes bacterium LVI A0039]